MRRLFIIRKDLHLTSGKLAAMVAHCSEAYFMNLILNSKPKRVYSEDYTAYEVKYHIPVDVMEGYICDSYVKTICEARNLAHLDKVKMKVKDYGLIEGKDWGYIRDKCLTELTPENEDGTTTVGIWFKPLSDDIAHDLSKKYQLYKGDANDNV